MTSKIKVGKKIKEARTEKKMSQSKLGQALEPQRSHAAISDIERGISDVSVTDLSQIAVALSKPLSFFIDGMPSASMDNFRYSHNATPKDVLQGKKSVQNFDKHLDELISQGKL